MENYKPRFKISENINDQSASISELIVPISDKISCKWESIGNILISAQLRNQYISIQLVVYHQTHTKIAEYTNYKKNNFLNKKN